MSASERSIRSRALSTLKLSAFRLASRLGYVNPGWARRARIFAARDVTVVLDIGADVGSYGKEIRHAGYSGRIVSIEPLSDSFSELERAAADDSRWSCRQLAVGNLDGVEEMHISDASASSSFMPMTARHLAGAPRSRYVATEQVQISRLDSIWSEVIDDGDRVFMKLDVQGFELEALRGAEQSLGQVVGMQVELSLVPLFDGAPGYLDVIDHLAERGLRLAGFEEVFSDPESGEMLQVDGLFVRDHP
jgi:FkbM family methyltransferase